MAPYDLTNASSMNNIADLFTTANQLSNYVFGPIILVVLWFIIFIQLKNYSSKPAMLAASFITSIVAIFLFLLGMISQAILILCFVIAAISFVINWHGD
jgi:hypothetical protein